MKLSEIDLLEDTWSTGVPHEMFTTLRREAPVFWHDQPAEDGPGFWAITKYDDIRRISHDFKTFSSELGGVFIPDPTPEALAQFRLTMLNMDPPKHHRYRRLVNQGFTPRMVGKLRGQIEERARRIVDSVCEKGEIDFVADVASEMPAQVICDMIGVPGEDRRQIVEWSNTMVGGDDPYWQNTPEDGERAAAEIFLYCDQLAEKKRRDPEDDIMSVLVHADLDGDSLSKDELNLFFVMLCVAGNETTRNLISHSLLALIENPGVARQLATDPGLFPTATEEFLRWGTSIQNFRRTATQDTEIRGQEISEGDKVVLYYLSGNFDEDVFDHPHTFDIRRDPNEHLTFGAGGVHFCLGANLARIEIAAMLEEFVTRIPEVELVEPPLRMRSDFINGINRMLVRFSPAAPAA